MTRPAPYLEDMLERAISAAASVGSTKCRIPTLDAQMILEKFRNERLARPANGTGEGIRSGRNLEAAGVDGPTSNR